MPVRDRLLERGARARRSAGGRDDRQLELGPGDGRELEQRRASRRPAARGAGPRPRARPRDAELGERPPASRAVAERTSAVSTSVRHSSHTRNALPPVSVVDRAGELGRPRRIAPGARARTPRSRRAREPAEPQPHDAVGAPQVGERRRQRVRQLASVSRNVASTSTRIRRRPRARWRSSSERRRVGPVRVLDDQHERRAADGGRAGRRRAVEPVALRVRVAAVGTAARRRVRQVRAAAASARRRRAELGAQLGGSAPRELVERLDERAVRRTDDRVARAVEDERAARGRLAARTRAPAGSCPSRPRRRRARRAARRRPPTGPARAASPARSRARRTGTPAAGRAGRGGMTVA